MAHSRNYDREGEVRQILPCFPSAILDFVEYRLHKFSCHAKIHALVDGLGNPLAFLLSSGNDHDSRHAISLLSQIDIKGSNILGDKAYGAKAIREYINSQDAAYTIPPQSNVSDPWPVD